MLNIQAWIKILLLVSVANNHEISDMISIKSSIKGDIGLFKANESGLRKSIDTIISQKTKNGITNYNGRGIDLTYAVSPFICKGMTFIETETILRNAGFSVEPRPDESTAANPNRSSEWFGILAKLSLPSGQFGIKNSVYISIFPQEPLKYDVINEIKATWSISFL